MGAVTDRLFPALTSLEFAQLQATREADAAARGLFDAGADQVIVWDNHNGSQNLSCDLLDSRCEIALGVGFEHRWPGLDDSLDGILFVGYHAMDNTIDGVMCHSLLSDLPVHQSERHRGRGDGDRRVRLKM